METLLKKPEIKRDENGRFEQHGKDLRRTAKPVKPNKKTENIPIPNTNLPGRGPGRPKGSRNKMTTALKDMILNSLDRLGGEEYLMQLARDNSSAYASILGKVLPTTLAASDSDGGDKNKITFTRIIVGVDGHRHIEGKTPMRLPAPSPVSVENNDQLICVEKPSQNSASDDQ
jgi:hypothetical protein